MRRPNSLTIVVGSNDSLPDVLNRLRGATGGAAIIAIPISSSLFLTASEFRALKSTAEDARVALTVETDDRLRKQLASMFHLPVVDLRPDTLSEAEEMPPAEAPSGPPAREPLFPDMPRLNLPPPVEVAPRWAPRSADDDIDEPGDDPISLPPRMRRSLPIKQLAIGAAALVALLVAGGVVAFLLQTATVSITVKRQPVTAELTYAVITPGQTAPAGGEFTLTAEPVSMRVPHSLTIPVTGEIREPDGVASGTIALRNAGETEEQIAAGTRFTDREGIVYRFDESVTVPAAAGGSAGRADARISAVAAGESSNQDVGLLSGQLESGVYYSNRNAPIAGGSDRITKVVDQADIDGLIAAMTEAIPNLVVSEGLPDGRFVLPGSLEPGEFTYTFDHEVDDLAETLTIQAEMDRPGRCRGPGDRHARLTSPGEHAGRVRPSVGNAHTDQSGACQRGRQRGLLHDYRDRRRPHGGKRRGTGDNCRSRRGDESDRGTTLREFASVRRRGDDCLLPRFSAGTHPGRRGQD
jgi:hypothetical protein